ncbi:MAG: hypothetical protein ACI9DC_005292 [Gammaproteobacteria bacterium]|jgi:hypothetical protein
MSEKPARPQDRIVGAVMLMLGAVLFYETYSFKTVDWDWMGLPFWPRLVIGFLCALGVYFVLRGSLDNGPFNRLNPRAFLVLIGGSIYVGLIQTVGFAIMTPLFIGIFSWLLGPRTPRSAVHAIITAALGTLIILYVFKEVLYIQFPEGLLEEEL